MKRFQFIASFLGLGGMLKAQQWKQCKPDDRFTRMMGIVCSNGSLPAKNGECPVCGTLAASWKDVKGCYDMNTGKPVHCSAGKSFRLTRCKRCNCAFYQDAD